MFCAGKKKSKGRKVFSGGANQQFISCEHFAITPQLYLLPG